MNATQKKSLAWSLLLTLTTVVSISFAERSDLTVYGGILGLLLASVWHRFVLEPKQAEQELGPERLKLNLETLGFSHKTIKKQRRFIASGIIIIWLIAVTPPLIAPAGRAYSWLERQLKVEQVVLRLEYPSYLDATPKEIPLKGESESEIEVDLDAYVSVQFRYRKANSLWSINLYPNPANSKKLQFNIQSAVHFGHSAKSIINQLELNPDHENTLILQLNKNEQIYAIQKIKITPIPRPHVELSRAQNPSTREGTIALDVKVRSKIPLSSVEFQIRTASGYRMAKPIAEFANANEQIFDGPGVPFNTLGIPFTPKDTLYIKAVAKTAAENVQGESEELSFEIVTRESIRQDLMQALEKSLQALQSNSISPNDLKETLKRELSKAESAAQQMGAQSLAARQMEKITASAKNIGTPKDKSARETEQKIKNLLERLKREQTSNQVQNLLARLQNLKFSIQRSEAEKLPELNKDTSELKNSANSLKKQLAALVEKPSSGLTLAEKQAALEALKLDRTPENLKELEKHLTEKQLNEAINKSNSTLEHAQKQLGGVLAMLQAARQRAMREARERLTRADNQLQNSRQQEKNRKQSLEQAQEDLDALPEISDEFKDAARDAQNGNQKARQGDRSGNKKETDEGIDEAQEGIVRALAALQDEEEAERQSQQEQDGQNFRSAQEALAAQGQLDMGWRRQILEEIARLRAKGESSDSPSIRYLESRLR